MINQANRDMGGGAEPRTANSTDQLMSSANGGNVSDEGLLSVPRQQTAIPAAPKVTRMADAQALEAYVERRRKLAARIRLENPSCTEEEIEARLEQFGA
jgi:hypothetical protein